MTSQAHGPDSRSAQVQPVVASGLMAGCAHPNAPGCNEPPPTDGYILFWTPILISTLLVGLIATSSFVWRHWRGRG